MSYRPASSSKANIARYWQALDAAKADSAVSIFNSVLSNDVIWHAHHPVGDVHGVVAVDEQVWQPIINAFESLQREVYIFCEGLSNGAVEGDVAQDGKHWVSGTGVFRGRFVKDYCGIPATGEAVALRWGEFCRIENDEITEVYFLVDLIDLLEQTGRSLLPPARGKPCIYLPPKSGDGKIDDHADDAVSDYSVNHLRRFLFDGLNAYDSQHLKSMGMSDWFAPDVKWYGPGGIGLCNGLSEFETLHQQPWLQAFPDRSVQDLDALFAEGAYSAASGWSGVLATHKGTYLDCEATGRPVGINGMDWWKRSGEQFIENWVFVDMPHLFAQFGVDLLAGIESRPG